MRQRDEPAVRLTRQQLIDAPICATCYDYVDEPDCKIVPRQRGWVHVGNNSVRCPGQADDDTDDRAAPYRRRIDNVSVYVTSLSHDTVTYIPIDKYERRYGWPHQI